MANNETTVVDSILLGKMLKNGSLNIKKNMSMINALNVFPVPDGDTGTNMFYTVKSGLSVKAEDFEKTGEYLRVFCDKVLFSARGNSGIIFSQYLFGFAKGARETVSFDVESFKKALEEGVKAAYESVIDPTEGTMLTVIREAAEFASVREYATFEDFFEAYIAKMKKTLEMTPDLLPCLREAGVVDSGGAGIVFFAEGMYGALTGNMIDDEDVAVQTEEKQIFTDDEDLLKYGYCTDFLIKLNKNMREDGKFSLGAVTDWLQQNGESVVAFRNDDCVKIHVHTKKPGDILNYAQQFGEFLALKIENMSVQSSSAPLAPITKKKAVAVVAVANGNGLIDYMKSSGADVIINGGQTNNPSVESFIDAYECLNAETIICLPDNGNSIMAANQSAEAYKDANVVVIPSKTVAEGIAALSIMNPADSAENIISDMKYACNNVSTLFVTKATRDCMINGFTISKNDYIGLCGDDILAVESDPGSVAFETVKRINENDDKQVVTIYYGSNIDESSAEELSEKITEEYPFIETGVVCGGQDVYDYMISVE